MIGKVRILSDWDGVTRCYDRTLETRTMTDHTQPEPMPTPGDESVTRAVIADLLERERQGIAKYGTTLQTFNGRESLVDLYQELLDACQYIKQAILEQRVLAAQLAAVRNALVILYELNESGNVGGAVYEEAMDLAMDALRESEASDG